MWHLRDLGYFVTVADHRNFTRASQELFVSQPSLSKQIAVLERGLGTPLFHREHDGVRLTRAGEVLLPFARRLLDTASEAEAAVNGAASELTIGFWLSPCSGLLPDALAAFGKLHPETSVALRRADWTEAGAGVEARRADIGLLWWPEGCSAPYLRQELLVRDETVVALHAGHPLADLDILSPASLHDEVILDAPPEWRRSLTASRMARLGRAVRVVNTIDETIEYVASGLGVAILPASAAAAHMPATVAIRSLRGAPKTDLAAVWRPEDERLPQTRDLIQCIVRAARDLAPVGLETESVRPDVSVVPEIKRLPAETPIPR